MKKNNNSILGIDLGNNYIKTSENINFWARTDVPIGISHPYEYIFDGEKILIGYGLLDREDNKIHKKNILPLLYLAIYKSTIANNVKIVLGLPVSQYKKDKEYLKNYIMSNNKKQIADRIITIEDVYVIPEGASVIYNMNEENLSKIGDEDILIVDIGGGTTDTILQTVNFDKRIITKYASLYDGVIDVYDDVATYISEFYSPCTSEDAEKIVHNGYYKYRGKAIETKFISDAISKKFNTILQFLHAKYNLDRGYIYLTGGGSKLFLSEFNKEFKDYSNIIISENSFFDNAISYKKVGESLWQQ